MVGCVLVECGDATARSLLPHWARAHVTSARGLWLGTGLTTDRVGQKDSLRGLWELFSEMQLHELEAKIGYTFHSKSVLLEAVTHSSFSHNKVSRNQQLVFTRPSFSRDQVRMDLQLIEFT